MAQVKKVGPRKHDAILGPPFGKYEGKRKIREYGMTRKKYSKYFSDIIKYEENIQKNDNSDKLFSSH